MRIVLIGEAGDHVAELRRGLTADHDVVPLPAEAAYEAYDDVLACADVIVSLRLRREDPLPPSVRLFQVPGAGLDAVDLAAIPAATPVCNVYEHEIPIAEFAVASMLNWQIRIDAMRHAFASRDWADVYTARPKHGELYGRTVGFVGYGRIGRSIAARLAAFDVTLVAVDDHAHPDHLVRLLPGDRFDELLARADFVVVACPLTDETRGLIGSHALSLMKASAVLVNVARAPIVDEDALHAALRNGAIGGAILDVWYAYPASAEERISPSRHDFAALPNAWCTPHAAAWTAELSARRYAVIAENVNRLVAGVPLRNVVRGGAH